MKTLIAITGWHGSGERAEAQRATWVKDCPKVGVEVKFFLGRGPARTPQADEVFLDCHDGYKERKEKITAICRWALERNFDYVWKVDDDVYLRPERLLALQPHDYQGCITEYKPYVPFGKPTHVACFGPVYGLSSRSMKALLEPDLYPHQIWEDIWVGYQLFEKGIHAVHIGGFDGVIRMPFTKGQPNGWPNQFPPHPDNHVAASCEYTKVEQMVEIHQAFEAHQALTKITINPSLLFLTLFQRSMGG